MQVLTFVNIMLITFSFNLHVGVTFTSHGEHALLIYHYIGVPLLNHVCVGTVNECKYLSALSRLLFNIQNG